MTDEPKSPGEKQALTTENTKKVVPRSRLACLNCRRRKVRCNLLDRTLGGCANCTRDEIQCQVADDRKYRRKISNSAQKIPRPTSADGGNHQRGSSVWWSTQMFSPNLDNDDQALTSSSNFARNLATTGPPKRAQLRTEFPVYIQNAGKITKSECEYLKASDCFTFPSTQLEAAAVHSFRDFIYPNLPVVDMSSFFAALSSETDTKIPLLLYHALICAGLAALSSDTIRSYGYTSKTEARNSFCSRAKALLSINIHRDPILICQVALLLISCPTNIDRKDAYYWSGLAINYAQTAKLHLPKASDDHSSHPRWLRERIWATVMMKEIDVCLAIALPVRLTIRVPDRSVFQDPTSQALCPGTFHSSELEMFSQTQTATDRLGYILFEKAKLSFTVSAVLAHLQEALYADWSLEDRNQRVWHLDTDLQRWEQQLSTEVKASLHSPNTDDRVLLAGSILFSIYLMTVIVLHKSEVSNFCRTRAAEMALDSPESDRPRDGYKQHLGMMKIAADEVTRIHIHLQSQGLENVISTIGVAALCAAIGVHLLDARFCTNNDSSSTIQKAEQCLDILRGTSGLNGPAADLVNLVGLSVLAAKSGVTQIPTPSSQAINGAYCSPPFANMTQSAQDDASISTLRVSMADDLFNLTNDELPDDYLFAPFTPLEDFFSWQP